MENLNNTSDKTQEIKDKKGESLNIGDLVAYNSFTTGLGVSKVIAFTKKGNVQFEDGQSAQPSYVIKILK